MASHAAPVGPPAPAKLAYSDGGPWIVPQAGATLGHALRATASASDGHGLVYVHRDGSRTTQSYRELLADALRTAGGLVAAGATAEDHAILVLDGQPDLLTAFWGCILAGVVPVPVAAPPRYDQPHAALQRLQDAIPLLGAPFIVTDREKVDAVRVATPGAAVVLGLDALQAARGPAPAVPARADQTALLLLTSGTTGVAKGVPLTHRNVLAYACGAAQQNGFDRDDVALNWMPLDHVGGLVMFHLRDVVTGARQVQVHMEYILQSPLRWLDLASEHRVTLTWAPNFAFGLVHREAAAAAGHSWDLSRLRFIVNGGEPIVAATARRFLDLLAPFGLPETAMHPAWGMSETSSGVTYSDHFRRQPDADEGTHVEVGRPIPGIAIRIADPGGEVLAEGESGALQVKGAPVTAGFHRAGGVDRTDFTPDGWFRTGDLGVIRDGRLTIVGREKDVIIINGINYARHAIESVVESVAGVRAACTAACAVRLPGDDTDRLAVFSSAEDGAASDAPALAERIRAALALQSGVVPAHVVLMPATRIPKTSAGKIRVAELRRQLESGAGAPAPSVLLHQRVWRRLEAPAPTRLPAGPWIVFADDAGLGDAVAGDLRTGGAACILVRAGAEFARIASDEYRVDPAHAEEFACLLAELEAAGCVPRCVLHLWGYDANPRPQSLADFRAARIRALSSLLFHVRAVARTAPGREVQRLWAVSKHAWPVQPDDPVVPAAAGLTGLIHSVNREFAWIAATHLDLGAGTIHEHAAQIRRELTAADHVPEVAYRGRSRLQPLLERAEANPQEEGGPFLAGGSYVVTGGLGGVGSALGRELLGRYHARVLAIGRSAESAVHERARDLARRGGTLEYVAADIADRQAVHAAIAAAESRWGRRFDGVFHLAAAAPASVLTDESPPAVEAAFRAKLDGAWVLQEYFRDRPRTLQVHFGSVFALFGAGRAVTYAAANAALAGFAHAQHTLGHRSTCISWTQWSDTGMSRGGEYDAALCGRGFRGIAPADALRTLSNALHRDAPHWVAGLDEGNIHVRRQLAAPPPAPADPARPPLTTPTEAQVARIWEALLQCPVESAADNFFGLGGDSLLAVRAGAQIDAAFGVRLPVTALFRAPELRQLAAVIDAEEQSGAANGIALHAAALRSVPVIKDTPVLFCIAGAGESAAVFQSLAEALPPGGPVWGLEVTGLEHHAPPTAPVRVEDVARRLVAAMHAAHPHGPYAVVGHCLGGLFAYEAAQQLHAAGEAVNVVGLIDTLVGDALPIGMRAPLRFRLAKHREQLAVRSAWGRVGYLARKALGVPSATRSRRRLRQALAPIEAMHRQYRIQSYPGRLTVFLASDSYFDRNPKRDPRLQWAAWGAGGAEIIRVAGDHETVLHHPWVEDLAARIDSMLSAAAGR